jgi:hypothetical protein
MVLLGVGGAMRAPPESVSISVARALLSLEISVHEIGDPKQEQCSLFCSRLPGALLATECTAPK